VLKYGPMVKQKKFGKHDYWYLATPYSKYPDGIEAAFSDAAWAAGKFVEAGINVYCPIAHSHPIAIYGGLDPLAHEIWLSLDRPFMEHAYGLIVVKMPSWDQSFGVRQEIEVFERAGKPIVYHDWPIAEISKELVPSATSRTASAF
jgi:hypothetical protein